jgi:Vacuolar-sorting-associated 13 protein C-terminal
MPLALELDSATLQLLQADLLTDLKYVEKDHTQALVSPERWIEDFTLRFMSPSDRMTLVSVHRSRVCAQASQMYIEKLILHPMKLILTFVQTPFPRKSLSKATFQTAAFNFLTSLAGVDRMQLKLKSFEVEDVLESRSSLLGRIRHKTLQDLQSQLAQIAGTVSHSLHSLHLNAVHRKRNVNGELK